MFIYSTAARWLIPLRELEPRLLQKIPGSEFVIITIFIILAGLLVRLFILEPIIHWGERLINKIPFIRTVYKSSKILVDFFNVPDPTTVKRKVVLIEYPRKGSYNIAFLFESADDSFAKIIPEAHKQNGRKYFKVFMPNSPNPTSGYFFILPEDEIIHTNMSFEEAIRTVVSCGLITPESLKRL